MKVGKHAILSTFKFTSIAFAGGDNSENFRPDYGVADRIVGNTKMVSLQICAFGKLRSDIGCPVHELLALCGRHDAASNVLFPIKSPLTGVIFLNAFLLLMLLIERRFRILLLKNISM